MSCEKNPEHERYGKAPSHGNYRDLSMESEDGMVLDESFPVKLHYMLADIERDGKEHIVGWHGHGRCFSVSKQSQFAEDVMKCYFRQSKFPSFQRQLNLYGFRRVTQGPDKGAYYHECFLRNKPFLATKIQRHRIKGTGARKPAAPEKEPDFLSMPTLPATDMTKYEHPTIDEPKQPPVGSEVPVEEQARSLLADSFWDSGPAIRSSPQLSPSPVPPKSLASPQASPQAVSDARLALLTALGNPTRVPAKQPIWARPTSLSLSHPDVSMSIALNSMTYDQVLASCTARRISQLVHSGPPTTRPMFFTTTSPTYFPFK